jgi:hypothetical protein
MVFSFESGEGIIYSLPGERMVSADVGSLGNICGSWCAALVELMFTPGDHHAGGNNQWCAQLGCGWRQMIPQ